MPISRFYTDTITVEKFLGTDGNGNDIFDVPISVMGYADQKATLVRDSTGEEVVASTTVYTGIGASAFTPNSRVRINGSTDTSRVITSSLRSNPNTLAANHLAVTVS